jgi:DNA primase
VATSGTSFGEGHVKVLRRLLMDADQFLGEVIFTFDGDTAGQRAVLRAFELEEKFVTQTFVAVQEDGLDPCDLRRKHGDAAVRDLVARRVPVFEFAIRSELAKHNLDTNEGRLAGLDAAARIIARIKDRGLRDRYAVSLDRWLGMLNEEFVLGRVRSLASPAPGRRAERAAGAPGRAGARGARNTRAGGPSPDQPAPYDLGDPVIQVEREALKLAVQRPALCGPAFDGIDPGSFTAAPHTAVRALIDACGGTAAAADAQHWVSRLRDSSPNDQTRGFVTQLAVEPLRVPRADGEPDARYADAVLARLEEIAVSRRISEIKSRLQRLNPVESAVYNRTFGDLVAMEQRRKALLERAAGAL